MKIKNHSGVDDAQIDTYLEAQIVADIRAAKNVESRKFVPVAISSKAKTAKLNGNSKNQQDPDQYEFLDETDDGLPNN